MCDPTALAIASISTAVVSAGFSAYQNYANASSQAKASKMQQDYQQKQFLAESEANRQAAQRQIDQLNIKQTQITEAGQEELTQAEREARAEKARAVVAAGESGVSGNLVQAILGELSIKKSEELSAIEANTQAQMQQAQYEKKEAYERGKTVGQGPANVIMQPSLSGAIIGGGLGMAGAGLDALMGAGGPGIFKGKPASTTKSGSK